MPYTGIQLVSSLICLSHWLVWERRQSYVHKVTQLTKAHWSTVHTEHIMQTISSV